jgi:hypothetical protein
VSEYISVSKLTITGLTCFRSLLTANTSAKFLQEQHQKQQKKAASGKGELLRRGICLERAGDSAEDDDENFLNPLPETIVDPRSEEMADRSSREMLVQVIHHPSMPESRNLPNRITSY